MVRRGRVGTRPVGERLAIGSEDTERMLLKS